MPATHPLRFGIKTSPQHVDYDDIVRVWRAADEEPAFDDAWDFDHFMPLGDDPTGPCLEGWTLLAALAAQTQRLRVGVMVTGNTYRHPTVLANMGATVDIISGGRLDFGIGAGWNELEHTAYGIPLYAPGERIRRFGEACEVIRLLWTETVANFDGKYYQLKDARCEPKPVQKPYPPFVIGGGGEQLTLRVVARYADIWNYGGGPVDVFQHKNELIDQYCAEIDRDPATIRRSMQTRVDYANLGASRDTLREFAAAGASHLVLYLNPPYPADIVSRLAREVITPVRAEHAG
ncbi:MAG TPA: LLM class F420-dependent oxidoreductase [Ktedonobacterales bacterium]|jgi:F420-dependent oxidoreductase-like protein